MHLPSPVEQPVSAAQTLKSKGKIRNRIQRLHLLSTLIVGVLVLAVSLSGAVAVFLYPAQHLFLSHLYQVTASSQPVSIDEAVKTVKQAYPAATLEQVTTRPHDAYHFGLTDPTTERYFQVFVDPGTGKINGDYRQDDWIIGWITSFHQTLFASGIKLPFGITLDVLLFTIAGIALLIMVCTGAYLWFPGIKRFLNGFKLRASNSQLIRHYDWHKLMGILALPWLFMWALSGLLIANRPLIPTWNAMVFSAAPESAPKVYSVPNGQPAISFEEARRIAATATGYPVTMTVLAADATSPITVGVEKPGYHLWKYWEYPGTHDVLIDQYSGKVLSVFEYPTYPLSFNALFGIHMAASPSPGWRILWSFFGAMPFVLAYTGLSMGWIKRQQRLERKRLRRQ
ncbi:MAG: PepSY domain-containing protein [Acaryochloridaceae cyanobacterium CSU_3_4]|nr:PepSY domain-containing protein [Acaryochloris sp. SU_5_25]NJN39530.1 PepSY domain-containing protein [Acaryochloridaceae cyanobacterium CSU_3_4]